MANGDRGFCHDYFLLNPEEASYFDIFSLLFSSELKKSRFIQYAGHQDENFRRRWFIFISLLAQKLLILGRKPMALVGYLVELWLNLLSCNGGLLMLLHNLKTGELVWPNRSSPMFRSMLGHIDTRFELDDSIKPGDNKYKASLSMMAAKIVYENEAFIKTKIIEHWEMKLLKFYNFWNDYIERYSTQALMLQDTRSNPNLIVVAFRGTSPFSADDWRTDVDISWYELKHMRKAKTHSGFMKALGMQKNQGWPKCIQQSSHLFAYYTLREKLREVLTENPEAKFIVTGHSQGGALAILFASVLILHKERCLLDRLEGVYTFGQPRVGDKRFGELMNKKLRKFNVKYFRYVYNNDLVPRIPFDDKTLFFKHVGPCLYFNSFYKGKVLLEAPNKNYFSLLWVLPKIMTAIWELIRGFILPYTNGPEYREGWFLRFWRTTGVVLPGVSTHLLQDYVNSTRLGTFPLALRLPNPGKENEHETN